MSYQNSGLSEQPLTVTAAPCYLKSAANLVRPTICRNKSVSCSASTSGTFVSTLSIY